MIDAPIDMPSDFKYIAKSLMVGCKYNQTEIISLNENYKDKKNITSIFNKAD